MQSYIVYLSSVVKSVRTSLPSIKKYFSHVVGATIPAEAVGDVVKGYVKTLSGKKIGLKKKGDSVMVKCPEAGVIADVEEADVFARNGVIHAIDKVLIKAKKEKTYN